MSWKKHLPTRRARHKATCLALVACLSTGTTTMMSGCGGPGNFLLLHDYGRDILFGVGAVAISLLADQGAFGLGTGDGTGGGGEPGLVIPGADGISCWDLNGDGVAVPSEDMNGDGFYDALDCRGDDGADGSDGADGADGTDGTSGTDGLNCWDRNENGIADPTEDYNGDGEINVDDCRGRNGANGGTGEGPAGAPGANCWDTNGNGTADPEEDTNGDGDFTGADCLGADGQDGADGTNGMSCWDINGNGIADPNEDLNEDGEFSALDCFGGDGTILVGEPGEPGLDCWDLNGNGVGDPEEDVNGDEIFDALDCQGADGADGADGMDGQDGIDGADGLNCWDTNGNGVGDPEEDINGDEIFDALDCQGTDGADGTDGTDGQDGADGVDGTDGLSCWDLNGDGIGQAEEDIDNDGFFTALDCRGADGADGADGTDGVDGQDGADGADGLDGTDGINCWDTNGNGLGEPEEDINADGSFTADDCRGADGVDGIDGTNGQDGVDGQDGTDGVDGLSCWDLNADRIGQESEDINGDGNFTAEDCRGADGVDGQDGVDGADGQDGADGINCWDLNADGIADESEDTNGDGFVDVLDCRAGDVADESILFNTFVDDFFTVESGSYGSIPVGADGLPVVNITEPALGACNGDSADVAAFRTAIPERYTPGNPVTMRMFIWRTGPSDPENCFTFRLDAFRARHGEGISGYGDARFVALEDPADPDPSGTLIVADLPLNTGGDFTTSLGLPNDLAGGDLLAFEMNEVEGAEDGGCYTLIGVEFDEWNSTDGLFVDHATVGADVGEIACIYGGCEETTAGGSVADSDYDGVPDGCDECDASDLSDTIQIDGCDTGIPSLITPKGCTANDLLLAGILECAERHRAGPEGAFQNCVTGEAIPALVEAGLIRNNQKGAISSCTGSLKICEVLEEPCE